MSHLLINIMEFKLNLRFKPALTQSAKKPKKQPKQYFSVRPSQTEYTVCSISSTTHRKLQQKMRGAVFWFPRTLSFITWWACCSSSCHSIHQQPSTCCVEWLEPWAGWWWSYVCTILWFEKRSGQRELTWVCFIQSLHPQAIILYHSILSVKQAS